MNKLAVILGTIVLAVAIGTAPMPLTMTLNEPARSVTIYPNVLFAVPLILLGTLLLLYGITLKTHTLGSEQNNIVHALPDNYILASDTKKS